MPHPSLQEFRERLLNSGLLLEDEIDGKLSAHKTETESPTAESFARVLVKNGTLTAWQARQVYRGRMKSLVLGNYLLLDKLGQGGMGMVFKAEHRIMQRTVALKTLSPAITKSSQILARFRREVQVAAKLDHPNIVTAYDAANEGDIHYLVMQFVEGDDLASYIRRKGVLDVAEAVDAIRQAANGLQYAHEQGVIHRDIKPSNLLIDKSGTVRILDMGLARLNTHAENSSDITASGTVMGTIDYMSPEQAENTRQADARSDIYSLGCTLYYLLTAHATYRGDSIVQRILAHRDSDLPQLVGQVDHVGKELEKIFQKMIAKNPAERYQTMAEVVLAIDQLGTSKDAIHADLDSRESPFDDFLFSMNSEVPAQAATNQTLPGESFQHDEARAAPLINTSENRLPKARSAKTRHRISKHPVVLVSTSGLAAVALLFGLASLNKNDDESESGTQTVAYTGPPVEDHPQAAISSEELHTEIDPGLAKTTPGRGLLFDGLDDYAVIPTLSLNDARPVTLEAWLTPHSESITANPIMLMGAEWMTLYQNGSAWGVGKLTDDASFLTRASNQLVPNRKVHLAGVWDGSKNDIYLDGRRMQTNTSQFQLQPTISGLFLGGAPREQMGMNAPDRFFLGEIHQVRVSFSLRYSTDFIPEETLLSDSATIGLYRLNEGVGDVLKDLSGNGHHGKIHGATWLTQP